MPDWVATHRRRKWRLAGKLAKETDNRWCHIILKWRPRQGHGRSRARPQTRWANQLEEFAGGNWMEMALDTDQWDDAEEVFANWTF
jgi:hypothetical protein